MGTKLVPLELDDFTSSGRLRCCMSSIVTKKLSMSSRVKVWLKHLSRAIGIQWSSISFILDGSRIAPWLTKMSSLNLYGSSSSELRFSNTLKKMPLMKSIVRDSSNWILLSFSKLYFEFNACFNPNLRRFSSPYIWDALVKYSLVLTCLQWLLTLWPVSKYPWRSPLSPQFSSLNLEF